MPGEPLLPFPDRIGRWNLSESSKGGSPPRFPSEDETTRDRVARQGRHDDDTLWSAQQSRRVGRCEARHHQREDDRSEYYHGERHETAVTSSLSGGCAVEVPVRVTRTEEKGWFHGVRTS